MSDTQEIHVNGKLGKAVAVWEFIGKLAAPLIIPLSLYAFSHYGQHARMRLEIMAEIADKYPPQALVDKVEANTQAVHALERQVDRLDSRLTTKIDSLEASINRLLED